ncbi:hypothetical protein MBOU_34090 [Mycobacterium bourgelatii]|uniref:Uncharacterized protein n=1 Tax=Mycobacterium bourgelatii TaxID=1273442 RepID=A0A7I9YS41_MYCBU|nr:hypothetical protein MBOU_34090 [Mycobacterium bourgelatii]
MALVAVTLEGAGFVLPEKKPVGPDVPSAHCQITDHTWVVGRGDNGSLTSSVTTDYS